MAIPLSLGSSLKNPHRLCGRTNIQSWQIQQQLRTLQWINRSKETTICVFNITDQKSKHISYATHTHTVSEVHLFLIYTELYGLIFNINIQQTDCMERFITNWIFITLYFLSLELEVNKIRIISFLQLEIIYDLYFHVTAVLVSYTENHSLLCS
jgi:hypothetical protein